MQELAKVIKTENNKAVIRVERTTACGECGKCMMGKKNLNIDATVDNTIGAAEGDYVIAEMQLSGILAASWIMYAIPLAAFIIGALLGYYLLFAVFNIDRDMCGFVCGLVLTAITYMSIRIADRKGAFREKYSITLVRTTTAPAEKQ